MKVIPSQCQHLSLYHSVAQKRQEGGTKREKDRQTDRQTEYVVKGTTEDVNAHWLNDCLREFSIITKVKELLRVSTRDLQIVGGELFWRLVVKYPHPWFLSGGLSNPASVPCRKQNYSWLKTTEGDIRHLLQLEL